MADEKETEGGREGSARLKAREVTGGTDKTGPGGLAGGDMPDKGGSTNVRETGDLTGATSTHAGAGGNMENTGGTGTAPTEG